MLIKFLLKSKSISFSMDRYSYILFIKKILDGFDLILESYDHSKFIKFSVQQTLV